MRLWPFKKKPDIDQLIFDYAERRKAVDERELVAPVPEAELFASYDRRTKCAGPDALRRRL
jgi:hypothetical protein